MKKTDEIIDDLEKFYDERVLKYGNTLNAVRHKSKYTQELRHTILSRIVTKMGASVLDVGCGFGDLFSFLKGMGWKGDYTGIDISEQMLLIAREKQKFQSANFFKHDISEPIKLGKYDYVLSSGTMEIRIFNNFEQYTWARRIIENMWKTCNIAMAFNMRSTWEGDLKSGDSFAYDPQKILKFCQTLTNCIIFDHSYLPHDFTIFMIREQGEVNWKLYNIMNFLRSLIGKK